MFVLVGAGWHKANKLKAYPNIEFLFLPPYSPELNPVERFWQFIKDNTIKNQIYKTLSELENEILNFLKGMTNEVTASVCHVDYLLR